MDEKPCEGDDYITVLKNNIISSLVTTQNANEIYSEV